MNRNRLIAIGLLIVGPAVLRALRVEWNVVPIGALALFCGAHFRNQKLSFAIPVASMLLGDVLLAIVTGKPSTYLLHATLPLVYGCYAVNVVMGLGLRNYWDRLEASRKRDDGPAANSRRSVWQSALATRIAPIAATTLAGSLLFFIVTNFGDWAFYDTYAKSWRGLADCYFAAIPFFRGTVLGDAVGALVLFGGDFALARSPAPAPES